MCWLSCFHLSQLSIFWFIILELGLSKLHFCLPAVSYEALTRRTDGRLEGDEGKHSFLSTPVPSSVTSGLTLRQQQSVPVVISYNLLSFCLFYILMRQIRDPSTATWGQLLRSVGSAPSVPPQCSWGPSISQRVALLRRCGSQPHGNPALSIQSLMANSSLWFH